MMQEPESDSGGYVSPEEEEDSSSSQVAEFFRNKCVFITGVSGFIGKVLLEKLLRSCSGVRTVYVLLRNKDDSKPRQRLDEILKGQVFARLRRENPKILLKIVPIFGDLHFENFAMSESDTNMLAKHVSVVFHSAATVRFDTTLSTAVRLNLLATQRVLQLCRKMDKLSAFIHVSTAYSYCNRRHIDEVIYEEKISPQKVIDLTKWMDESMQEYILPKLMDGRPTTYHYTKALAENLLQSEGVDLPIAIVRPSIVTAAYKEPYPGWVDGVNGPSSFIIMTGKGLLRTMLVYEGSVVDWIPVDLVANLMLTAAWHIGTHRPSGVKVFNCTSGNLNRITWRDIERTAYPLIIRHPSSAVIRYPGGSFKSSPFLNFLSLQLEHKLPAYAIDSFARLFGVRPGFVALVERMERAAGYLQYFTTKEWTFQSNNVLQLREMQSPTDRKLFDFDVRPIEWLPYLENYVLGVRKYILEEDKSTLPAARRKLNRLYYAGLLGQIGTFLGILYLLLTRTNLSNHILWGLISIAFRVMQYLPHSWLKYLNSISI